eukprot:2709913-Rhodomonas_salina.1
MRPGQGAAGASETPLELGMTADVIRIERPRECRALVSLARAHASGSLWLSAMSGAGVGSSSRRWRLHSRPVLRLDSLALLMSGLACCAGVRRTALMQRVCSRAVLLPLAHICTRCADALLMSGADAAGCVLLSQRRCRLRQRGKHPSTLPTSLTSRSMTGACRSLSRSCGPRRVGPEGPEAETGVGTRGACSVTARAGHVREDVSEDAERRLWMQREETEA